MVHCDLSVQSPSLWSEPLGKDIDSDSSNFYNLIQIDIIAIEPIIQILILDQHLSKRGLGPGASALLGNLLEMQTPYLQNQNHQRWGSAICVLTNPLGNSNAQ